MENQLTRTLVKALGFTMLLLTLHLNNAHAANIRHTYSGDGTNGDPFNSFYLDERGGSAESNPAGLTYFMTHQEINQHGLGGGLVLFVDSAGSVSVEEGFPGSDFTAGSDIQVFDLSLLPLTSAAGEIGLDSILPVNPVFYTGNGSQLLIEQVSFTSYAPDANFVGIEYSVVNTTAAPVDVSLGLSNDFDAGLESDDFRAGVVGIPAAAGQLPTVYVVEVPPYAPEVFMVGATIAGSDSASAIYRLEDCPGAYGACAIFGDDGDVVRNAFFQDAAAQGDLTGGVFERDYAVSLATGQETLAPGGRLTTVFCHPIGSGVDEGSALTDLQAQAEACRIFYEDEIQNCQNFLVNLGEECDDGDVNDNNDCLNSCVLPTCGDGVVWDQGTGTEQCDDGNEDINDACPSGVNGTCQNANCGDGFLWNTDGGTEECDNGAANSDTTADACRTNCEAAACGDTVVDTGETCDDGNANDNDDCLNSCEAPTCGDGILWDEGTGTEECDDGAANSDTDANACRTNCQAASCGDGIVDAGETCDAGAANSDSGACLSNCQAASCGDGFIQAGVELCDTGIAGYGADCQNNCTVFDSCGNGVVGDNPLEQCDDGNNSNTDACPNTCQNATCGDGFIQAGVEACDDGNTTNGDGCSSTCTVEGGFAPSETVPPVCGDGNVDEANGETCDDGNTEDLDGCSSICLYEPTIQGSGNPSGEGGGGCTLVTDSKATTAGLPYLLLPMILLALWRGRARVS